jgi:hypothetical protein
MNSNKITDLGTPTATTDAATKGYVDTQLSSSSHNITFVGDDSTGTAVTQGETFKFAGTQNITTAVSGDTLTITGPDLSSYATQSFVTSQGYIITDAGKFIVVGDDSTGTTINLGETIKIAGTQNITTAVSGDTLTVTGPDLSNYLQNTGTQTIDNLTFNDNIIGTSSNADLELSPGGTGAVKVTQKLVLDTSDNDGSTVTIDATKPVAILQGNTGADDLEYTLADGTVAGQTIMLVRGNNPDDNRRESIHVIFSKFNDDGTITTNTNKEIFSQYQSVVTCIWNGLAWCTAKHN